VFALWANTTGNGNVGAGWDALYNNTAGGDNTANGQYALYSNTNGNNNTSVGDESLYQNTSGQYNIALGFQSGYNTTTGNNNVFIGNTGLASDNNVIRIGSGQIQSYIAGVLNLASNCLVAGNVGIGTTTPGNNLDISGGIGTRATISFGQGTQSEGNPTLNAGNYNLGRSSINSSWDDNFNISTFADTPNPNWTIGIGNGNGGWSGNKFIYMNASGNLGIGTSTPATTLDVNGPVTARGTINAVGGLVIQNLPADPPSPAPGQIWLRTDLP